MSQNKERTVAYPHRVFNKASIYLASKTHISNTNFNGYESKTSIDSSTTLTTKSPKLFDAKDGKIFDYVLSRIQAISLTNQTIELDTVDVLKELALVNRTENRAVITNSYKNLLDVDVSLSWAGGSIDFKLLEAVNDVDGDFSKELILSQSFINAMDKDNAKRRYINIKRTMSSKSGYTIELSKLLQMDGQGVNRNGAPIPVQKIKHSRVCTYLNLETSASAKVTIRKAFNELEMLGYPKYKFNGRRDIWELLK